MESSSQIDYSPRLTKWGAFWRCSTWTIGISFFSLLPILIPGICSIVLDSNVVNSSNAFNLNTYFQDGSIMIFVLGLLGGLAMDFAHDPDKEKLRISIRQKRLDCKPLFLILTVPGFFVSILVLIAIVSNPGHVSLVGQKIEWYIAWYSIVAALILKFVVFATL